MSLPVNIRNLYTPIQPTIRVTDEHVTYQEIAPNTQLLPFIYCYWQLQTTAPSTKLFHYQVVADACIAILIELRNEPWGDRHFTIKDPNGIGIDIVKYAPEQAQ